MSGIIKFAANRVWRTYQGGKLLDEMQKKACPADSSFPEDWIGSMVQATNAGREALSEGLSMITSESGELTPFKSLVLSEPDFYLGQGCEVEDVPLVKYLDSATRLHFQVHPSREFAKQRLGSSRGKTEAYVILAIRDDIQQPYIYAGFQRPPSRKQLKSWIEQQNIDEIEGCFDKIPVKPGDVFLIPGGRPHALGEGILMLEIMEPSDLAVRFEFERCGYVIPEAARFMNRDIETALDVFDFSPVTGESIDSTFRCSPELILDENGGNMLESLIDSHHTPCFRVRRATTKGIFSRRETSCFYGIVAEGCGMIKTENQSLMLNQWDRFFCPAGVEAFSYHSDQNMTVLECYPGGLQTLLTASPGDLMASRPFSSSKRARQLLSMVLPGIFLLGFNIGTGSVTTMAKAGADYGMSLLWALLLSCCCTFFMINLYGRFTLVTGQTALQAFKQHIHPWVSLFFIFALGVGVCGSVMGVMGIVADICYRWSLVWTDEGIHPVWFALFFITLVYVIFWRGNTRFFERFLAIVVAIMSACFLLIAFLLLPTPESIVSGLIPRLPSISAYSAESPLLVTASLIGTTVFSGLFIIRTTLVKEAGWTLAHYANQRNDAAFSVVLMFVISASIMAASAGTLHIAGTPLINAAQMIELLEPLAGQFAVSLFATGLVAAGVSSQFPNVLMLPWLICDYSGIPRDMTLMKFRLLVFGVSLLGLVVPIFNARPVLVMIVSQALNAVILPLTVVCILYLSNCKSLMGQYRLNTLQNLILIAILLFSIFTAYLGLSGVWQMLMPT